MHDIDRTQLETELEGHGLEGAALGHEGDHEQELLEQFINEQGETEQEADHFLGDIVGAVGGLFGETEQEIHSPVNEAQEVELASELLEVSNELEMEQFLGNLFKSAVRGVSNFAKSSTGRALGGVLKNVAKKALPIAGKALGAYFGGPMGSSLGGQLGGAAANLFEVEMEGLSQEDREFEVARQFVRFGATAAKQAAHQAHSGVAAPHAVRSGLGTAARAYAPGLLRRVPAGPAHPNGAHHPHPGHPGHPGHVGHPGHPGHMGHPGHPGHMGHPGHPGHMGHPGHPGHHGHMGHPGHPGHPGHVGHPGHMGHPGHPGHMGHPGHPGHHGHHGHHGHPGYAGQPDGFALDGAPAGYAAGPPHPAHAGHHGGHHPHHAHGGHHGSHAIGRSGHWVRRGHDIILLGYVS